MLSLYLACSPTTKPASTAKLATNPWTPGCIVMDLTTKFIAKVRKNHLSLKFNFQIKKIIIHSFLHTNEETFHLIHNRRFNSQTLLKI